MFLLSLIGLHLLHSILRISNSSLPFQCNYQCSLLTKVDGSTCMLLEKMACPKYKASCFLGQAGLSFENNKLLVTKESNFNLPISSEKQLNNIIFVTFLFFFQSMFRVLHQYLISIKIFFLAESQTDRVKPIKRKIYLNFEIFPNLMFLNFK